MQEINNDKMLEKNKHEIIIFVNGEEKIVKKGQLFTKTPPAFLL